MWRSFFRFFSMLLLCGSSASAETLRVFAAASLKESLDQIAADWRATSGAEMSLVLAGSSTLARQIEAGAPADVFFSADRVWMDFLQERELIDPSTRIDLLGNALVLIAPSKTDAHVELSSPASWSAALGDGRLAIAEIASVPAGRYAKQGLDSLGVWDALAGHLAQAENVRAALAFVALGEAPLGIVYLTDARAEPRVRVIAQLPDDSHQLIVYSIARLAAAPHEPAGEFIRYLQSTQARAVFVHAGFSVFNVQP